MMKGFVFTQEQTLPLSRIFYSSFRPEGWDIYLSTNGGDSFSQFTTDAALDYDAIITPDGNYVVFTSERSGHPQLYVQAIDGTTSPHLLIKSESMQDQATISPDGRWIAFVSTHEGNADIYKLPFETDSVLDVRRAINLTQHPGGDFRPSFSPDGHLIAFCSDRANPIVPNPDFSFARQRSGNIFTMDAEGRNVRQLTHGKEWDGSPEWSQDGMKIFYYSMENRIPDIFSMYADGSGQKRITPLASRAMSPCLLPNGKIAFTSWQRGIRDSFRVLIYDTLAGEMDTLVSMPLNMLHLDAHKNGTMVFHGGTPPVVQESNKGGFVGNLLIAGQPFMYENADLHVESYGIRRAFTAPVFPDSPYLIIDHTDIQGIMDAFSPWCYVLILFPLIMAGLIIAAIIQCIRFRKQISYSRYIVAFVFAILVLGIILGMTFYMLMVARLPLNSIRLVLAGLAILCMLCAFFFFRKARKKKIEGIAAYKADRVNGWSFGTGAVASLYLSITLHALFNMQIDFYKVNYITQAVSPLFTFKPGLNLNPSFSQFIDGRISNDSKQFLFTIGGFGAAAHHQGDVWALDIETGKMNRRTDSNANSGFGDMSSDGNQMVFRSGRHGQFDLYLEEDGIITQITRDTFKENFPTISPQGDKIVFASNRDGVTSAGGPKTFDLYLMERSQDGVWSDPRKLTNSMGQNAHPSFSPDGEWIIYTTEDYGIMDEQPLIQYFIFSPQMYGEITALRLQDMKRFRFTHNKWEEGAPQWVQRSKD